MTLSTYSELAADVALGLDRDDRTDEIQKWVRLVEFEVSRKLGLGSQQGTVSGTLAGGEEFIETPAGILYPQSLVFDTDPPVPVDIVTFAAGEELGNADGGLATPPRATVWGVTSDFKTQIYVWPPPPADVPYTLRYMTGIAALTPAAPTNYLLLVAADVYFFGVMYHACKYDKDFEAASSWRADYDEQIRSVKRIAAMARAKAGRLRMRSQYATL